MLVDSDSTQRAGRVSSAAALAVTLFLLLPLVVYASNLNQVSVEKDVIAVWGAATALAGLTFLSGLFSLPRIGNYLLLTAQVTSFYIFCRIVFPISGREIDGFSDLTLDWSEHLLSLVFVISGILFLRFRPQVFAQIIRGISIIAIASSILCYFLFTSVADTHGSQDEDARIKLLQLGTEANVIVLVLDAFTGYRFAEIITERPQLTEEFRGFTLYPRALAPAKNTAAGSSIILTGRMDFAVQMQDWKQKNSKSLGQSFLTEADNLGVATSYISPLGVENGIVPWASEKTFFALDSKRPAALAQVYAGFLSVSALRVFPAIVSEGIRAGADLLFGVLEKVSPVNEDNNSAILSRLTGLAEIIPLRSKMAFDYLVENIHSSSSAPGRVLYFHSKISHEKWNFTEDGQYVQNLEGGAISSPYYVVNRVVQFLDKLREIDAFDNTTIIITADHGGVVVKDPTMGGIFAKKQSLPVAFNPLMLVKSQSVTSAYRESEMTVWLGDIYPTVLHALGANSKGYGPEKRSLLLPEFEERMLSIPLFQNSDTSLGGHSALKYWRKVQVEGSFKDYGPAIRKSKRKRKRKIPVNRTDN